MTVISEKGYKELNGKLPKITKSNKLGDTIKDDLLVEITYIKKPIFNQLIQSEYKINDKIKIYFDGIILESLPGQIDSTELIKVIDK